MLIKYMFIIDTTYISICHLLYIVDIIAVLLKDADLYHLTLSKSVFE